MFLLLPSLSFSYFFSSSCSFYRSFPHLLMFLFLFLLLRLFLIFFLLFFSHRPFLYIDRSLSPDTCLIILDVTSFLFLLNLSPASSLNLYFLYHQSLSLSLFRPKLFILLNNLPLYFALIIFLLLFLLRAHLCALFS
jgi:hypothetical protein